MALAPRGQQKEKEQASGEELATRSGTGAEKSTKKRSRAQHSKALYEKLPGLGQVLPYRRVTDGIDKAGETQGRD